ncbi:DUF2750 domain-containing protein [Alkalimonas delamerensis]|uniref:DUF2750 domain-containing protein n=1 Tax=Alkalimonas delamerensis TaxID=265981 RepID=A0ABT9GN32_9GAMM|nr:DUF2750 domain-containing protein [Alkalimonas delamerensis]MDP4528373.1 DUF2750 domain-containing protein [Alkalimonas delamerensis]
MEYALSRDELNSLEQLTPEQRYDYFVHAVVDLDAIWILVDDEGFVLVSAEDERCIPVWPHAELAERWIDGEWSECQAQSIPLATWLEKWTSGLESDELAIAVFPDTEGPGVVVSPVELEEALQAEQAD